MTDHGTGPGLGRPTGAPVPELGRPSTGDSTGAPSASTRAGGHLFHPAGDTAGRDAVTPDGVPPAPTARAGETGPATPLIPTSDGSGDFVTPSAGGGAAGGGNPIGPVGLPEAVGPAGTTGGTSSGGAAAGAAAMVAVLAEGLHGPCLVSVGLPREGVLRLVSLVRTPVRLPD
jgi:hypothetical protein